MKNYVDLEVFDIAELKFWGPESKFERNERNQIFGREIQNRNRIWSFEVQISYFSETQIL